VPAFDFRQLQEHQEASTRRLTDDDCFDLAPRVANPLRRALEEAPLFQRLADAGKHLVRTIHGTIELYADTVPGDFDFYLGRCGATPSHLFQRFESHAINRDHIAGTVAIRCSTEIVETWETAAIRVLQGLRNRNRLCVANILCHGGGRLPATEYSAIYLTWRLLPKSADVRPAIRRDVDLIADEVSYRMAGDVSRDCIARALDPITRPVRERADLAWARGHSR